MASLTVIDAQNYSTLTTQLLITSQNAEEFIGYISAATDGNYGHFKGYRDKVFTLRKIQLQNRTTLEYFIETGKASMIMIHGVRTLLRMQEMTETRVANLTRT